VYAEARALARPRTWRTEREHWRRLLADLGDTKLRDVDPRAFARWVRGLTVARTRTHRARGDADRVPASGAYRRLLRAALQALMTYAYVEGHLDTHVRIGEIRLEGSTLPARAAIAPLSLEEVGALCDAARTPVRRAMWAVGVGQGLRPGELVRVRWEDVDWNDRTLAVRGTKTEEAEAVVPLTPIAHDELHALWLALGKPKTGPAFRALAHTEDGRGSSYKKALARDAKAAGIARRVYPYLLRHSFATLAWSLGIDRDVARRIMRHTDLAMLDKVYTRPRPADLVERVAGFKWAVKAGEAG
jgi:integrase